MANTNVNIRMDADLKKQFEAFCSDMGMMMTTAFNVFAKKAVREYRIPFEIGGEKPNAETREALDEVSRESTRSHYCRLMRAKDESICVCHMNDDTARG